VFAFQSSDDLKTLYEKAKYTMETKGDLQGALTIFEQIVGNASADRSLRAKAQLHIGLCYEKLGLQEAQKAYQKVVNNYPEQTEVVKVANEKLSLLLRAENLVRKEDGFNIRQVWSGPDVDTFGAPSPDGRYLSYTDWETGDLAIRELATGKTRRLTKKGTQKQPMAFALNSVISPDNKLVAYSWFNEYSTFDLCLIGIDGSADRTLYSNKDYEAYPHEWSSDGEHIAAFFFSNKDKNHQIVWVSVADGSVRVLKTMVKGHSTGACVSHSPDDRYIAYDLPVEEESGNYDIYLLATDGSDEIPLIEHPANDRLLGWAPRRKEILFKSDRLGTWDAWSIQVTNGKPLGSPKRIKSDVGGVGPLGFTQDGSFYFSISTRRFTTEVAPFDLKTGKVREQLSKPLLGSNYNAVWSPDGEYLAYVTEQTGTRGPGFYHRPLHILHLKTGEERELAGEIEVRAPRWSRDGCSILVTGYDNNKRNQKDYNGGVYKIDVQDGHVTELVQFPPVQDFLRDVWWETSIADWSHDGKAVFYVNRGKILMRELESSQEKQLYQNNNLARLLNLSPDGKRLVFGNNNEDEGTCSILIMPVSGGEPRELCKFQASLVPWVVTWTPDGEYVLYTEKVKEGCDLWRISPDGGDPQKLWQSDKRNSGLSIHPDGQQIAFSTYEQDEEIWVMENFLPALITDR
ncbi:MAG: PD40 domain-containing protein, partial [Desulfobacteraceae bacterium]|nr:PD40 domain-containing protein [Desulfobacteraceae bacterium]